MNVRTKSASKVDRDGFSAHTDRSGTTMVAYLKGNADMAVQEDLKGFLDYMGVAVRDPTVKEAVFDFAELYFMNSSCLSLLLRFINGVIESLPAERVKIKFRSNPNLRWQQKSLQALRAYAHDLVVIE